MYPEVTDAYIDDAQIQVAVMLAAEMPNPILLPAVMYSSAFSLLRLIFTDMNMVSP